MPKIYKRNCDFCGKYYEGQGDKFCSKKCYGSAPKSEEHLQKLRLKRKGKTPGLGKHHSEAWKINHSNFMNGKMAGEKNPHYGKRGAQAANWKGGRRYSTDGYVWVYSPNHPYANKRGYYPEHRLVAEKILNRILMPNEIIHHIKKRSQNQPEYLYHFTSDKEHRRYHSLLRVGKCKEIHISNLIRSA